MRNCEESQVLLSVNLTLKIQINKLVRERRKLVGEAECENLKIHICREVLYNIFILKIPKPTPVTDGTQVKVSYCFLTSL